MMKTGWKTFFCWALAVLTVHAAETIELVNGDRISGDVIKVESGKVYLRSELLGEIQLPVEAIKTDLNVFKAGPLAPVEEKKEPLMVVMLPPEEKAPAFDLRSALHIPKNLKGDIKFSAYRRERDYLEDSFQIAPRLSWNNETHSWEWRFDYRYRRDDNTDDAHWAKRDDRMTAEQKYRYNFDKTVFAQSRTFWERDVVKGIDPRFIQSVGLGLYILNTETLKLDVAPGIGYEYVDNSEAQDCDITPTFDQNFQWVINSHFNYTQRFSWLGKRDHYQYDFINELEARLNDHLSVVLEHRLEYDQQVQEDAVVDSKDQRTMGSVRLRF